MTQQMMKKYPLSPFLILNAVLLLYFSGCASFKIIVLKDPLTPEEHLNLGVAYERKGQLDHAIKEYLMASKKLPIAYLYLGNAHFQKTEYPKAEKYYKKAIRREPKHADAYNNLAWLYYTIGQHLDEGERLALKAIELNPAKEEIYKDTLEKIRELKKLQK